MGPENAGKIPSTKIKQEVESNEIHDNVVIFARSNS